MNAGEIIPIVAVAGGMAVALVAIVSKAVLNMSRTKQFEQSRREIAAYVAEGTITPDDGARLLASGPSPGVPINPMHAMNARGQRA